MFMPNQSRAASSSIGQRSPFELKHSLQHKCYLQYSHRLVEFATICTDSRNLRHLPFIPDQDHEGFVRESLPLALNIVKRSLLKAKARIVFWVPYEDNKGTASIFKCLCRFASIGNRSLSAGTSAGRPRRKSHTIYNLGFSFYPHWAEEEVSPYLSPVGGDKRKQSCAANPTAYRHSRLLMTVQRFLR